MTKVGWCAKQRPTAAGEDEQIGNGIGCRGLDRWKTRHGISSKRVCGEEREVSPADTESWRSSVLPPLLEQFKPEDIYNLDETGLFFRLKPDRTLEFTGERCSGGKKSKDRLTVLVGASMSGERLPLLVIGKSKNPGASVAYRTSLSSTTRTPRHG